ncbi:cytochrome P450 [Ramicandelaber brevisporus]|nr:cytochrome P450 [Ramicandelaber brevisporus]
MGALTDTLLGSVLATLSAVGGIPGAIVLAAVGYTLYVAIYNRYFHPLRHIPGPLYSTMFQGMATWDSAKMRSPLHLLELHEQYGPIVRYEPQRLSYADHNALRTIYSTHSFPKASLYTSFDIGKMHQIFSTVDVDTSKKRKRMLGPSFGAANISQLEELIHQVGPQMTVDRLNLQYRRQSGDFMTVDLYNIFFEMTFGVIGRLAFGKQMISVDDDLFSLRIVQLIKAMDKGMLSQFCLPRWSWDIARDMFGMKPLVDFKELVVYASESILERRKLIESGEKVPSDLLQMLMDAVDPETGDVLTHSETAAELIILCFAGVDTSSNTLTWTLDQLFQHPGAMARLEAEVLEAFPDKSERITYKVAKDSLPFMDAVLLEAMRMRTVGGEILSRVVPEGGREVGGIFVPGGYEVGISSHVMHNYSEFWDDPEQFRPERYLEGTPDEIAANRQKVIPFSVGVRSCIGRQLALVELVVGLATLIQQFEIKPAEQPYVPLEMQSAFVMSPTSKSLMAKIRPRK